MAKVARFFLSERHQAWFAGGVRVVAFVLLSLLFAHLAMASIRATLRDMGEAELAEIVKLRINALAAFAALDQIRADTTTAACSEGFRDRMRAIAFLPDGLNEFLYAPSHRVLCSTSADFLSAPVTLPEPDLAQVPPFNQALWINRSLDTIGLRGLSGTIVAKGAFAVVLPPLAVGASLSPWMKAEIRTFAPDGRSWFRGGSVGLFDGAADRLRTDGYWTLHPVERVCAGSTDCAVVTGDVGELLEFLPGPFLIGIVLAAVAAELIARAGRRGLARYCSFEARFRRHLDADSVVCLYQPIIDVGTGEVVGCEVLARWRDLDGTIVTPDRFLPIVEASGLTRIFTRHVVARAYRDLDAAIPAGPQIRVNFNIFPADLVAEDLFVLLEDFIDARPRFKVILEIVESDRVDLPTAGVEIEKLRAAGFEVWMDDFGTGYFSVENLVHLQLDGVKLDRCFAMAPEASVMGRMLYIALEMIAATGRPVVVEGVDSVERMEALKANPHLARFAQGYLFSRPIPADAFARFLNGSLVPAGTGRAAA